MRRWWITGIVAALAVVLLANGAVSRLTNAAHIEKRLTAAVASAHGVNRVTIGSSHFSPLRGSFVLRDLEFLPDSLLISRRTHAGTPPQTRYTVTVSSIRVHGIRFWPLLRGTIKADSVAIDSARVDVCLDRTVARSSPVIPAILPHVSFQSMSRPIRIGAIRVTNSDIGYSETARDGSRPGTIRFTDLSATVHHVTNDSAQTASSTQCTVDLRTRVAGAGRLNATLGYDFRPSRLNMTYRGTVTRMNAEPLNDLLVNLAGIRITSGVIDSTWFDFTVSEDVARGKVQVLYRDFNFEKLDKITLERSVGARLKTFIINKTKLNHANPSDDHTVATVVAERRERPAGAPLLKFLWQTLRQGFMSTLGI